jgi:SAM-dependent methyltransferase
VMESQQEQLKVQYRHRFVGAADYRDSVWRILCSNFFSRYIPTGSRILELGAGWGEFINNIIAAEKYAMDLNPDTGSHLTAEVKCIHQDCSSQWKLEPECFDVVFTSNFLEHLPDKASVARVVAEAHRCLKQGGLFICMGANIKFVPGAYWDFWDHHIPFTELSCAELLRLHDFSIDQCIPRFLPYSMSTGMKPPLCLVKYYLKLPMLWSFFGKQFLIIARKNAQEIMEAEQ